MAALPEVSPCIGVPEPGELKTCDHSDVKNLNMSKEVATRLFRMLAVSELRAETLKRDSASYAKMNLLTQQMNLLQAQAQTTVSNSVAKAKAVDADLTLRADCTALSAEFDEGAKRLLMVMAVDDKTISTIKRDAPASAKLSLLAEQATMLQQQAHQALSEAEMNVHLFEVAGRITCRLVPGTMYYHYTQHGNEVLSRIADDDWDNYDEFHGKYLYDWDFTFRRQLPLHEDHDESAGTAGAGFAQLMLLPPNRGITHVEVGATPATKRAKSSRPTTLGAMAAAPLVEAVERVLPAGGVATA